MDSCEIAAREPLEALSRRGAPAFATSIEGRVVFWNAPCATLLGRPASEALGQLCRTAVAARDAFGNRYCVVECPAAHHLRFSEGPSDHPFPMVLPFPDGFSRRVGAITMLVPAPRSQDCAVAHVLSAGDAPDAEVRRVLDFAPPPRPVVTAEGAPCVLDEEDRQMLLAFARGCFAEELEALTGLPNEELTRREAALLDRVDAGTRAGALVMAFRHGLL